MKKISIAALVILASAPVRADDAPPKTIMLPTPLLWSVREYLAQRPYQEVASAIGSIDECLRAQVPVNGAIRSNGGCSAVTEAMQTGAADKPDHKAPPKIGVPVLPPPDGQKPEEPQASQQAPLK